MTRENTASACVPEPIRELTADSLTVRVYDDRATAGRAAAFHVAAAMAAAAGGVRMVFAAAPSQNEFLGNLIAQRGVAWDRVTAFHMDEYLGLDANHGASFRRYLQEHLFGLVGIEGDRLHLIPGESSRNPMEICLEYENVLNASPIDIVCAGIGENGHLAFNDPPVADFLDPVGVKVVRLDLACRQQQVNDGCFNELNEVPTHAFTLTVPALMSAKMLSVVVPGPRKAEAVLAALQGPYSETCPATALRRHPNAFLFLDKDSARLVL